MIHLDHDAVAQSLSAAGFRADVRGDGAAKFVFAEAGERAVEISVSDAGAWIEYWDGDGTPKRDRTFASADAAVSDAKDWLARKAG